MKILVWALRFAILLVLVWFSVKNSKEVTLYAYPWSWEAPLVVVILAFFAGGVLLGLLASMSTLLKLRREVKSLSKALKASEAARDMAVAGNDAQSTGVGTHGV